MPAERPRHAVRLHARLRRELRGNRVRDDMDVLAGLARKVAREREVGGVHAAKGREVTGDEQPRAHARGREAIPYRAPLRNQNWTPIWVTNGVKLNISIAVPRFAASTIAAHARTRASESDIAIRH